MEKEAKDGPSFLNYFFKPSSTVFIANSQFLTRADNSNDVLYFYVRTETKHTCCGMLLGEKNLIF